MRASSSSLCSSAGSPVDKGCTLACSSRTRRRAAGLERLPGLPLTDLRINTSSWPCTAGAGLAPDSGFSTGALSHLDAPHVQPAAKSVFHTLGCFWLHLQMRAGKHGGGQRASARRAQNTGAG